MTDIVERLRRRIEIAEQESRFGDAEDMRDAIDIVERLRADIKKLNHELDLLEEKSRHD